MRKLRATWSLALALAVVPACKGDGGNPAAPVDTGPPPASVDLTGRYFVDESGEDCEGQPFTNSYEMEIRQNGNEARVVFRVDTEIGPQESTATGTVSDNVLSIGGTSATGDGGLFTVTFNATASEREGAFHLDGSYVVEIDSPRLQCTMNVQLSAVRYSTILE